MNEVCPKYHVPVMLMQSVDAMNIGNGNYVDVTFGGGGHTREILKRMGEEAHLFSFDQDADAIANVPDDNRFTFVYSNFRYLENWMNYYGVEKVDGIMADLGVSSHHFDAAERGFTFRADAPLDMRMNQRAKMTAAQFLNSAEEERIASVLYNYGELRNARRMASAIVKSRTKKPVETTAEFVEMLEPFMGRDKEKKNWRVPFRHCALK